MGEKEQTNKIWSFRPGRKQAERLNEMREETGRPRSEFIRAAIDNWLENKINNDTKTNQS